MPAERQVRWKGGLQRAAARSGDGPGVGVRNVGRGAARPGAYAGRLVHTATLSANPGPILLARIRVVVSERLLRQRDGGRAPLIGEPTSSDGQGIEMARACACDVPDVASDHHEVSFRAPDSQARLDCIVALTHLPAVA